MISRVAAVAATPIQAAAPYPDSLPTVGWRLYRRARAALRGPEFAG